MKQPTWTKREPKTPGWYFVRSKETCGKCWGRPHPQWIGKRAPPGSLVYFSTTEVEYWPERIPGPKE